MKPGDQYNSWTLIAEVSPRRWLCRCKCGIEKSVDAYNLKSERSKSCRKCSAAVVIPNAIRKHGRSQSKLYRAWQSMKTRCYNEAQAHTYKYHGARGVTVCDEWINDFEAFAAHIGEPPTPLHTVDRIKNDRGYEPGNVRWATQSEQMANRGPWRKKRQLKLGH